MHNLKTYRASRPNGIILFILMYVKCESNAAFWVIPGMNWDAKASDGESIEFSKAKSVTAQGVAHEL